MIPIYFLGSLTDRLDRASFLGFALCFALAFSAFPHISHADDGIDPGAWENRIAVYLWMAGLDGSSGNRLQQGDIEASFSAIMENLEAGFMLDYRGKKDKWGLGLDLIYLNINPGATVSGPNPAPVGPPIVSADGDVDVKQWIVDFTGHYEVTLGLELLAGSRYVDLDIDAKVTLPGPQQNQLKLSGQDSWVDPIIGAEYRGRFPNTDKWRYILHGDIGGFGVNSDLTWQLYGYVGYQPSREWSI